MRHWVLPNTATWDLRNAVNITAEQVPYGEDEFKLAGLTRELGKVTRTPMVKESPVKVRSPHTVPVGF